MSSKGELNVVIVVEYIRKGYDVKELATDNRNKDI
jgi:hypothetical protein